MKKLITLVTVLLFSLPVFSFEMGSYHNPSPNGDESVGCWVEVLPSATSIIADGSCYTEQGMSYNILGLVRTNYGNYEYTFEMNGELFVNKIVVSKDLLTFKIYNVETGELKRDEFLKKISDNQIQYYLSYADYMGKPDVQFDIILDREVK